MESVELYKSLLKAKKEMEAITKDSKNPFFKSKYFDINKLLFEVEPILQRHGLLLLQPIEENQCKTKIIHVETGKEVSSVINLGNFNDPQKMGSAITYYRRYTLQSLLGLQAEDDDGNKASKQPQDRKQALTLEGFEFLKIKGTKEQIKTALDNRRMSGDQREVLNKLYESKKNS